MKLYIVVLLFAVVCAEDNSLETAINFVKDCQGDYILCVKEKLLRIVENARTSRNINIVDGVILKGEAGKPNTEPLPSDPEDRDAEVNYRLLDGVANIFETHAVEVKMNSAEREDLKRSLEEGRGKGGGKKGGGAMGLIGLLAAKILFGKLFIVKLIALKALATAKIALVLSVILFVAWCLKQEHTKTTYEVVPHGVHHESHHPHVEHVAHDSGHGLQGYGSDWSKNADDAQNLAYSGYSRY